MYKYFVVGLACLLSHLAQSQTYLIGKVKDQKTKQPIAYCTVQILKKQYVAVANDNGDFTIIVDSTTFSKQDTIQFSCVGYESLKIPTATIIGNKQVFELHEKNTLLGNIVIRPEMVAKKLIEKVINKFGTNFSLEPTEQEAFCRSTTRSNGKFIGISESFLIFFSEGYNPKFSDDKYQFLIPNIVKKIHCRSSDYHLKNDYRGFPLESYRSDGMKELYSQKDVLYRGFLDKNNLKDFEISYADEIDNDYYVVSFVPKRISIGYKNSAFVPTLNKQIAGTVYISKEDLGIVKIETTTEKWSDKFQKIKDKLTNHTHRFVHQTTIIQFVTYQEKYYLSRINSLSKYEDYGWGFEEPKIIETSGELIISSVSNPNKTTETLKKEYGGFRQFGDLKIQTQLHQCSYEAQFWKSKSSQLYFDYESVKRDLKVPSLFSAEENHKRLSDVEKKEMIEKYTNEGKKLMKHEN
jgi:hypothetical protein